MISRIRLRSDALIATALAAILGAIWTGKDWAALSVLRLPDTDDGMRLQQIRDWLGGQAFADLTQYRLGAGVPMHWSRVADLVPAGSILTLTPILGRHGAELATVIVWPLILFAVALLLIARIARRLGSEPSAATACIVAAIAYPATTIFLPGRIDHHGLQVVLLLGATLALLGPATVARGAIIGLLAAVSLVVGLETLPLFAVLGAAAIVEWCIAGAYRRLAGLGGGAIVGLVLARAIFAPLAWTFPACDGFTASAWTAAMIAVLAPIALAAASPILRNRSQRILAAIVAGGGFGVLALAISPSCASPYGAVDPLLARLWLSQVGEAQSIAAAPLATTIGYCGLMLAGVPATAYRVFVTRSPGWLVMLGLQLGALAITAMQLRGAYAGAMLSAPALAATIVAARTRGTLPLAAAWLASAGMLYPIAARAIIPTNASPGEGACSTAAVVDALGRLPRGMVMAPIDVGGYGLPATAHRFVAGPYHRNTAGNRAMYRFYLGRRTDAVRIVAQWQVGYVVACPGMPGVSTPGTMAGTMASALATGSVPGFRPLARPAPGVTVFGIAR